MGFLLSCFKSKTIGVNALGTIILNICMACGYTPDPAVTSVIYMAGNIGLRFLTNKAIKDK